MGFDISCGDGLAGRGAMNPTCCECSQGTEPVWACYTATTQIDDLTGHADIAFPFRRCPAGHLSGWSDSDDFFFDLVLTGELEDGGLERGSVPADKPLLRPTRCGNCEKRLELTTTAERLTARVAMPLPEPHPAVRFDVDLPTVVCSHCGARPSPSSKHLRETAADLTGWLFQLIAAAMPPENAARVEPRNRPASPRE